MAIKPEELADAIAAELEAYSDRVTEDVKASAEKAANFCVDEVRRRSPVLTGDYQKGWRKQVSFENSNEIRFTIHNKTDYQLTHLLEHGHAKRGGGRVEAKKHISIAENETAEMFEKEVMTRLGR